MNYSLIKSLIADITTNRLEWDAEKKTHIEVPVHPIVEERNGGLYIKSDGHFLDFYGTASPPMWIHKDLEFLANNCNAIWEWESPTAVQLLFQGEFELHAKFNIVASVTVDGSMHEGLHMEVEFDYRPEENIEVNSIKVTEELFDRSTSVDFTDANDTAVREAICTEIRRRQAV